MRPWQARKEKSQKIRKVEGRILYGRDATEGNLGESEEPDILTLAYFVCAKDRAMHTGIPF